MSIYTSDYLGTQIDKVVGDVQNIEIASNAGKDVYIDSDGNLAARETPTVCQTGSYNDLLNKPTIPTESTVSGWGFTKNTGTYSKPSGGIPKSDLASSVQTSLGLADSALQSVPSTYRTAAAQDAIDANALSKTNIGRYGEFYLIDYSYTSPVMSISDANWHPISFSTTPSNCRYAGDILGTLFTASTSRSTFTCQVPGLYYIQSEIMAAGDTTGVVVWNYLQLSSVADEGNRNCGAGYWYPAASGSHTHIIVPVSTMALMSQGETITVNAGRSSQGSSIKVTGARLKIVCVADLSQSLSPVQIPVVTQDSSGTVTIS